MRYTLRPRGTKAARHPSTDLISQIVHATHRRWLRSAAAYAERDIAIFVVAWLEGRYDPKRIAYGLYTLRAPGSAQAPGAVQQQDKDIGVWVLARIRRCRSCRALRDRHGVPWEEAPELSCCGAGLLGSVTHAFPDPDKFDMDRAISTIIQLSVPGSITARLARCLPGRKWNSAIREVEQCGIARVGIPPEKNSHEAQAW